MCSTTVIFHDDIRGKVSPHNCPLPQVLRECYKRDRDYQFWKDLRPEIYVNTHDDCSTSCGYKIFGVCEKLLRHPALQLHLPEKNFFAWGGGGWFRTREVRTIRHEENREIYVSYEDFARLVLVASGESRNRRKNTVARYLQASEGKRCFEDLDEGRVGVFEQIDHFLYTSS